MSAASITPTLDRVALLLRTRTVGDTAGGLGGDTQQTATTTFTVSTRPTATEVGTILAESAKDVWAMLEQPFDADRFTDLAKSAVALRAAIWIEQSFFRESMDRELINDWQAEFASKVATINGAAATTDGSPSEFATLAVGTIRS